MSWTIKDTKKLGRDYLQKYFWKTWFITTLITFISYGTTFSSIINMAQQVPYIIKNVTHDISSTQQQLNMQAIAVIVTLSCGILLLNVIIKTLMAIFLRNPATVGAAYYMKKIAKEEPDGNIADFAFAFDNCYFNHVKTMFMRGLIEFVFGLLLIVPGIIKSYQYRMVPYILSENPELTTKEALLESTNMMKNQKMKLFLLDLSFIPWHLLGIITLGILEVFFVIPWTYTTEVTIYNNLRKEI